MSPWRPSHFAGKTKEWLLDEARYQREFAVYSEKDDAWEREFQRERLALVREQEAQARDEELKRTLAQIRAETLANRKALTAARGPKATAKRGPKGYLPEVKELILAEAGRMRSANKRVTASALLNRPAVKKLCEKLGHNSLPSARAVSRWVSLKRP